MGKLIKFSKFIFVSLFFLFIFFLFANHVYKLKKKIIINNDVLILVKRGISEADFVNEIRRRNIGISYYEWFIIKNIFNRNMSLKYGEYFFSKNTTFIQFQNKLYLGKTFTRKFTLIEGWNSKILKMKLNNAEGLIDFISDLKEGIYKPDTYNYQWGDSRLMLLKRMETEQNKVLDKYWTLRLNDKIINTKYEALILASIIEKETNKLQELKMISSVFRNRLAKKIKLQSDVTVAFGLNILGNKLTKNDLKKKNKFNTYINFGLPPTPICYPSEKAIEAAILPIKTNYLYFVADGKGGHNFSKSYKKHIENIRIWLKQR